MSIKTTLLLIPVFFLPLLLSSCSKQIPANNVSVPNSNNVEEIISREETISNAEDERLLQDLESFNQSEDESELNKLQQIQE